MTVNARILDETAFRVSTKRNVGGVGQANSDVWWLNLELLVLQPSRI